MITKVNVAREAGCFTDEGIVELGLSCPQMVRNFLLAEKYRLKHKLVDSTSVIISLGEDESTQIEIAELQRILKGKFKSKIRKVSLQELVAAIQDECPDYLKPWINSFQKRYLAFDEARLARDEVLRGSANH